MTSEEKENETRKKLNKRKDDLNNFNDYVNNLVDSSPLKSTDPFIQSEYEKINSINEKLLLNEKSKNQLRKEMDYKNKYANN